MRQRLLKSLLAFLALSVALAAQEFTHNMLSPPGNKSQSEYKYDPNNGNPHPVRVERKVGGNWVALTEASKPANVEQWQWERSGNVITITFGGNPSSGGEHRIVSDRDPNTPTPGTTGDKWQ